MRISDWSSDVCSSDLWNVGQVEFQRPRLASEQYRNGGKAKLDSVGSNEPSHATARTKLTSAHSIWRSDACAPFRRDLAAHLGSGIHQTRRLGMGVFRRHSSSSRQRRLAMPERDALKAWFLREILPLDRKRTRLNSS